MSKFTQGKWELDTQSGDIKSNGQMVARVFGATVYNEEGKASESFMNARLITAAPQMYKLLCECADELGAIGLPTLSKECWNLLAFIEGEETEDE